MINFFVSAEIDPNKYSTFRSTGRFSDPQGILKIYLQVYFDDLTKARVGTQKQTKLSVVYLTISNLPYSKQSKRYQIMLSLICKRKDLRDRNGLIEFFQPLVSSINEINSNPIRLSNSFNVSVVVSSVVADNPASNELNGICMSFRWNACRNCEIFLDEIRSANIEHFRAEARSQNDEHIFKDVCDGSKF